MAVESIVGCWYPSGYHGHFRSKSRNDFNNEFRYLAKPSPPNKFMSKSQATPSKHMFSHHDNRESFLNDALYFSEGLGRRRVTSDTNRCISRYRPDLIAWMPHKEELNCAPPKHSVYRGDFYAQNNPKRQLYTKRPKTSFDADQPPMTSYRYSHGTANPNRETLSAMNTKILVDTGTIRPRLPKPRPGRESVASCMSWYAARQPAETGRVPMATQTFPPTGQGVQKTAVAWE